jgi:hypothetical protein
VLKFSQTLFYFTYSQRAVLHSIALVKLKWLADLAGTRSVPIRKYFCALNSLVQHFHTGLGFGRVLEDDAFKILCKNYYQGVRGSADGV